MSHRSVIRVNRSRMLNRIGHKKLTEYAPRFNGQGHYLAHRSNGCNTIE